MAEAERNIGWILIISVVMYFASAIGYLRLLTIGFGVLPISRDLWYHLANLNPLFFILTITFSTLYKARFWKTNWTYKLSISFFIVSMSLLFMQSLRWLF